MTSRKYILLPLALSLLGACGGGSSSNNDETPVTETPAVETIINGTAIKGTIANAIVKAYKFVDGLPVELSADELVDSNITTNSDGSYSLTVLDYTGPIKVELSVGDTTTMTCDAPSGCGDVAFGESIALNSVDPSFTLSSISEVSDDNTGEVKVHVSALTHLAAELIEAESAEAGEANAALVLEQSSIIANAFGITGSLTELEPTKIDSAEAVSAEDNENELRYGLINAGVMTSLFSGESNANNVMSSKLAAVASDIIAHDGEFLAVKDDSDDGFELAIADVLSGASEAATKVATLIAEDNTITPPTDISLEQLETNLDNQAVVVEENAGDDGRVEKEIDAPTIGGEVEKAKAMVSDVRLFANLFDSEKNAGIVAEGDAYIALVEDAGTMIEAEAASFLLLTELGDAISDLAQEYRDDTLTKATDIDVANYVTGADDASSIVFDDETANGGISFAINVLKNSERVALSADVAFTDEGKSITITLAGTLDSAGATFTIADNSTIKVNLDTTISRDAIEDDTYEGDITGGEIDLSVTLAQKATDTVTNPMTFEGVIKAKLLPVEFPTLRDSWPRVSYDGLDTKILPESLTLSGGFSSLSGNVLKATLTGGIQNLDGYEAPSFKYIGAPVVDMVSVTTSADKNTLRLTMSNDVANIDYMEYKLTRTSDAPTDWQYTETNVAKSGVTIDSAGEYFNDSITSEAVTVNGVDGIKLTFVNRYGTGVETYTPIAGGFNILFEATPSDSDGETYSQSYDFTTDETIGAYVALRNGLSEALFTSNDATLIDHLLEFTGDNGNEVSLEIELNDGARAAILLERHIEGIGSGDFVFHGYQVTALAEQKLNINVSNDSNTVTLSLGTSSDEYAYTSETNGYSLVHTTTFDSASTYSDDTSEVKTYSVTQTQTALDQPESFVKYSYQSYAQDVNTWGVAYLYKIVPVDGDGDNITDNYNVYKVYGDKLNSDGELLGSDGSILTLEEDGYLDDEGIDNPFESIYVIDPSNINNAIDVLAFIECDPYSDDCSYTAYGYTEEIGSLKSEVTNAVIDALVVGDNELSAYITEATEFESLENEDVFLDINAALSLEVVLGQYEIDLMLSGERTALKEGEFDLSMSYKLPDDTVQRSFTVSVDTADSETITAKNSEGVVLVMKELDDDSDSNVIGTILVGSSAVKAAEIQDRDGIIMIVYSDETTETL